MTYTDAVLNSDLMNTSGWTPLQVGRLRKNLDQYIRYDGMTMTWGEFFYSHARDNYTHKWYDENSKYKYRLTSDGKSWLDISKLAYKALTMPELDA